MTSLKANLSQSNLLSRGILFSLIWWILADGAAASWWIGVPAVMLAVITSVALLPSVPLVWYQVPRFVSFFIKHSLLGGVDVAWRAFHPGLPIAPDLIEYPLQVPPGLPRVFVLNTVNLLPGTLSASLDGGVLKVHVLDRHKAFLSELKAVEHSVARVFGISLKVSGGGE